MIKFHAGMKRFFLILIRSLGLFSPTESFANLNSIACGAVCADAARVVTQVHDIEACDGAHVSCLVAGLKKKQGAPQPCTESGAACRLTTESPTTVSDPTPPSMVQSSRSSRSSRSVSEIQTRAIPDERPPAGARNTATNRGQGLWKIEERICAAECRKSCRC